MTFSKPNENSQKTPKSERLNDNEKPVVASYIHTVDISVGALFNQFSRIPAPQRQQTVNTVGASVIEQATQPVATQPIKNVNGELDINAIRQQIEQVHQNA